MSGWPAVRTAPNAPRPGLGWVLLAGLIAYVFPVVAGLIMMSLAGTFANGSDVAATLGVTAMFGIYAPLFSWVGLIPGMIAQRMSLEYGVGGWLVAGGLGLGIGGLLSLALGPLAIIFGTLLSLVYWLALRAMSPGTFRARETITAL